MTTYMRHKRRINTSSSNTIIITPPFTPDQLSGLTVWLKADSLSLNDGDLVTTWTDSSGNSNNAANTANKPTFKKNIVNTLPVVRFDGATTFLNITTAGFATGAFTIFGVVNANILNYPALIAEYSSTTTGYVALGGDNLGNMAISKTGVATSSSNLSFNGAFAYFSYRSAGISAGNITVSVWRNGTAGSGDLSLTGVSTNTASEIGASRGGSADWLSGDIAEIIYYNSSLSDANKQKVESYLSGKYAI